MIVVLILIGLGIVGCEVYLSLPDNIQVAILQAPQVFDMSEEIAQIGDTVSMLYDGQAEFHQTFYVAFAELFTIDVSEFEKQKELLVNAKLVVGNFLEQTETLTVSQQNVLGISIEEAKADEQIFAEDYFYPLNNYMNVILEAQSYLNELTYY